MSAEDARFARAQYNANNSLKLLYQGSPSHPKAPKRYSDNTSKDLHYKLSRQPKKDGGPENHWEMQQREKERIREYQKKKILRERSINKMASQWEEHRLANCDAVPDRRRNKLGFLFRN